MPYLTQALGLDPGLRHGALVHAEFRFLGDHDRLSLQSYKPLFIWRAQDEISLGIHSSPLAVCRLGDRIVNSVISWYPDLKLGIDWSVKMAHWKSRREATAQLAFLVGYVVGGFPIPQSTSVMIEPRWIRERFSLPYNSPKEKVHQAFREHLDLTPDWVPSGETKEGDITDALILALSACMIDQP